MDTAMYSIVLPGNSYTLLPRIRMIWRHHSIYIGSSTHAAAQRN
ncbi:hypothetical protein QKW35_16620 [Pontibacterium granulatum]|nr:hypothetical protein [Pontibacterium granulatum]MDI3326005.1 hypothetical protein [Pontibacterium granulatum]